MHIILVRTLPNHIKLSKIQGLSTVQLDEGRACKTDLRVWSPDQTNKQLVAMLLLSPFPWWQFPYRKDIVHPKRVLSLPNPIKLSKIQGSSAIRLHHGRKSCQSIPPKRDVLSLGYLPFFLLYNRTVIQCTDSFVNLSNKFTHVN